GVRLGSVTSRQATRNELTRTSETSNRDFIRTSERDEAAWPSGDAMKIYGGPDGTRDSNHSEKVPRYRKKFPAGKPQRLLGKLRISDLSRDTVAKLPMVSLLVLVASHCAE